MGLILGRKDGGKVKERKDKGGKVKMTASSHLVSLQLVGGRKRRKICENWESVSCYFFCLFILISCPYFHVFSLTCQQSLSSFRTSFFHCLIIYLLFVLFFSFPLTRPSLVLPLKVLSDRKRLTPQDYVQSQCKDMWCHGVTWISWYAMNHARASITFIASLLEVENVGTFRTTLCGAVPRQPISVERC